jgi:hypothetical protein
MKRFRISFILLLIGWLSTVCALPEQDFPAFLSNGATYQAPFADGEQLTYVVNWKPLFFIPALKAGEIRLSVDKSKYHGHDTYRIQAWADSAGSLTRVVGFSVRNYFESQVDRQTFRSYRIFQKIRQGNRQRDLELIFDYDKNRTTVHETDPSTNPPRVLQDAIKRGVPPLAVDVISVFYVARVRAIDPGEHFAVDLSERGDFRRIRVMAESTEEVKTPVGNFPSLKLSTTGGLFRDGGDFHIWLSLDSLRVPTKFETDVKFGKVYGELTRLQTPTFSRRVVRIP